MEAPLDASGNPFRYTGRKLDPETGLYYYRARYYDPDQARFLETDPDFYEDQMNLYAYVANDPINFVDPDGRHALWVSWVGQVASAAKAFVDDNGFTVYASTEATLIVGTLGYEGELGGGYDGSSGEVFDFSNSTDLVEDNFGVLNGDQPPNFGLEGGVSLEVGITLSPEALTSSTRNVSLGLGVFEISAKFDADTGQVTGVEAGVALSLGASTTETDGRVLD